MDYQSLSEELLRRALSVEYTGSIVGGEYDAKLSGMSQVV